MKSFDLSEALPVPDLSGHLQQVDTKLRLSLATEVDAIDRPLQRLLKQPGKRLRASLVIASAASFGHEIDEHVIMGAVSVELVHMASLIHDDAIDNAASRRGAATVNQKEGYDWSVLVGDFVLAQAHAQAAQVDAHIAEHIALTVGRLCEGQALEMMDQNNFERTRANYMRTIQLKTAALMDMACRLGALGGKAPTKHVEALGEYGEKLGIAFQLIDDVLDFVGSAKQLGKPAGTDYAEGVYTLPVLMALECDTQAEQWFTGGRDGVHFERLVQYLCDEGYLRKTVELANDYNLKAAKLLPQSTSFDALRELPSAYTDWALRTLVDQRFRAVVT